MKFLLLFFIFMVLLWQWRHAREQKVKQAARKNAAPLGAIEMVQCAQCGVHLPATDALKGANGLYCSALHRQTREP
jgi:uncharacterized protein